MGIRRGIDRSSCLDYSLAPKTPIFELFCLILLIFPGLGTKNPVFRIICLVVFRSSRGLDSFWFQSELPGSRSGPRRHEVLLNKKSCLLVQQEGVASSSTRRHVFLLNKTRCLHNSVMNCTYRNLDYQTLPYYRRITVELASSWDRLTLI